MTILPKKKTPGPKSDSENAQDHGQSNHYQMSIGQLPSHTQVSINSHRDSEAEFICFLKGTHPPSFSIEAFRPWNVPHGDIIKQGDILKVGLVWNSI